MFKIDQNNNIPKLNLIKKNRSFNTQYKKVSNKK